VVHALEELQGVKKAYAHFPEKRAVVVYDPALVTTDQMRQALLKAGYVANPEGHEGTTLMVSHQDPEHKWSLPDYGKDHEREEDRGL
jgi:cation transport ATPase